MIRFPLGGIAALVVLAFLSGCSDIPVNKPPNIALIIGDDHGYRDFGFMGSTEIRTPHLDRLASEGTLFTHGFNTASVCDPSLRSIVTGLHPFQWDLRRAYLRKQGVRRGYATEIVNFDTLPRLLAARGYQSFQAGKFFGGSYDMAGFTAGTNSPDIDLRFGGEGKWFGREDMEPLEVFLDTLGGEDAPPFFIWFAPMLPHGPFDAGIEHRAPYEDKGLSQSRLGYYANITRFDALVGAFLASLETRGLRRDTLVIYLADNGWDPPLEGPLRRGWDSDDEHGKRSMYEIGFRTPIVFNQKSRIPAGDVHAELVSTVDLFPTILDYAGVEARPDRPGEALRPLIEGRGSRTGREVFAAMGDIRSNALRPTDLEDGRPEPATMLRNDDWHFISYDAWGKTSLFDVRADPEQHHDVAAHHPERIAEFQERIAVWRENMTRKYQDAQTRPPVKARPDPNISNDPPKEGKAK